MRLHRIAFFLAALVAAEPAFATTVQEVKSPSGLSAYLVEDHTAPIIAFSFSFAGGSGLDPDAKLGLSTMATSLLDEGAGALDSFAFQTELADRAITLRFQVDRDEIIGTLVTTTPNAARALELMHMSLTQARFDAEPVERIRREIMVDLASRAEDPNQVAQEALFAALFPNHSYGRKEEGTPQTVGTITDADLHAWVKARFGRDRLLVAASGDINAADLGKAMDTLFAGVPATTGLNATLPPAVVPTKADTIHVTKNLPQTVVLIGQKGMMRNDPDWYAASIDDYVFGAGQFESRLMNEVREKRGLAYGVSTELVPFKAGATMIASVGTRSEQAGTSVQVIRDEWKKMHDAGPTQEEIDHAKQYLTGAWPLRFVSTEGTAQILLTVQRDKLGLDYLDNRKSLIESVTLDQARKVARELYDPDHLIVVMVGPPAPPGTAGPPPTAAPGKTGH